MKNVPVLLKPLSRMQQIGIVTVVASPICAIVYAIVVGHVTGLNLSLWLSLYVFTGLWGVCIGLHRYFTHGSFKTSPVLEASMAIAAHMALEGRVREWVPNHLIHHDNSDKPGDLHSPHRFGNEEFGFWKGFIHAHIGWAIKNRVINQREHMPHRLLENKLIRKIDRHMHLWAALSFLIAPLIGGLVTLSWYGAWTAFVWGSLLRIALVHHITWSVNSICHIYGSRPFVTDDESRNNWLFGILAFGEGWHENHHVFCRSARHGILPGQPDLSAWVIERLEQIGLVWDVIRPTEEAIQKELVA